MKRHSIVLYCLFIPVLCLTLIACNGVGSGATQDGGEFYIPLEGYGCSSGEPDYICDCEVTEQECDGRWIECDCASEESAGTGSDDSQTSGEESASGEDGDENEEESSEVDDRIPGPPDLSDLQCADCGEVGPCEEVSQDPDTCQCTFTILAGNPCDDGDVCTLEDTCSDEGECISGATDPCDDDDPCTMDSCEPAEGCINEAMENCEGAEG